MRTLLATDQDPTKDLRFEDQVKRSRFKSITTKEARAWQNIFPGRHEPTAET